MIFRPDSDVNDGVRLVGLRRKSERTKDQSESDYEKSKQFHDY
jgi:hypothetical protein